MDLFNMSVPCLFGIEGLCADELKRLGASAVRAENGRVLFSGGAGDIARANINLRTGERVLLVVGETPANTFDELFEGVRAMPWERYITKDGAFPVKGHSLGSALHSVPDCQRIIKKAAAERLKAGGTAGKAAGNAAGGTGMLKETGAKFQIQFAIMKDIVTLYIDTSGAGLHKRGYRPVGKTAPLRETLAAAMVKLSRYKGREAVRDPFCGSGTIAIEAALAAINRAPGLNRRFEAQSWSWIDGKIWADAIEDARGREYDGEYDIWGGDIDPECVAVSKENAARAGVSKHLRFETADAAAFAPGVSGGTLITNPPYGERVLTQSEAEDICRRFGAAVRRLDSWKMYVLSSHADFERVFGKTAAKKRKLYNGMIKCDLYMYY